MMNGKGSIPAIVLTGLLAWISPPLAGDESQAPEAGNPNLEIVEGDLLVLSGMPMILNHEEVSRHLTTGLTTTFAFRFETAAKVGGKARGGARVEIRYELWDEVFHTVTLGMDGRPVRHQLTTLEELHTWWRELRVPLLDLRARAPASNANGSIEIDIVPFSKAERDDTQRWLYDSALRAGSTAQSPSLEDRADRSPTTRNSLEQVFGVLIATSLRSRAVTSFRWQAKVPAGATTP
ncbi:MAG: hypothetical protein K0U98_23515 [Deltaproteobacteria bacterium]|nr:hypothetical protein [Deltaproteobacteria bacterium]